MKSNEKTEILDQLSDEGGFSLIEISILLIVIGFIFIPILRVIEYEAESKSYERTFGLLSGAESAINQFYGNQAGAYPCPASLTVDSGDALSGVSADCTDLNNFRNCSNPTWETLGGGTCRTSAIAGNAVIIGSVPYAEINADLETSLDVWGNRIIYAVPFLNTDVDVANNYQGVRMQSLDSTGAIVSVTDGEIFVFSTGSTGAGGYTKDGVQIAPCGLAVDGYESENCDFDNTFFRNEGSDGVFSRVVGTGFFDDITRTQESYPISTWFEHEDNPGVGGANNRFAITASTRIGVGTNEPDNTLHVNGGIRIQGRDPALLNIALSCDPGTECFEPGGRLKTPSICDDAGDCFEPEMITESRANMRCDSAAALHGDQPVLAIHSQQVHCASPEDSGGAPVLEKSLRVNTAVFPVSECSVIGEVATGINALGEVTCAVP